MYRRTLLKGALAAGFLPALPRLATANPLTLTAAPGEAPLVVPDGPATKAWLYNATAPGPVIRARQGDTLSITVQNDLPEPTTVHWHGLRVPVAQDGMPFLSQDPIAPGDSFDYELPLHDAGTFWYHPHVNSSEQVGRGLHGLLIVEEPPEIAARLQADRDLTWAIDDWRLDQEAQIAPFGNRHDQSHGGRTGNVLTVNGTYLTRTPVRAGERIRLRICNVSNAQNFHLNFAPFDPWLIALDGHPVTPQQLGDTGVWLGAGQRADLILDIDVAPGTPARVIDDAYGPDRAFEVMTWEVSEEAPLRDTPLGPPEALPHNPVADPDLANAETHKLTFDGGAMGGMAEAMMEGRMLSMQELVEAGRFWSINGTVPTRLHETEPLLKLAKGKTHRITLENRTRWPHPIHLHGHSFRFTDPRAGNIATFRDTALLMPDETTEIALVADNPGKWMLHCHILEHQASGMMGVVEVA